MMLENFTGDYWFDFSGSRRDAAGDARQKWPNQCLAMAAAAWATPILHFDGSEASLERCEDLRAGLLRIVLNSADALDQ